MIIFFKNLTIKSLTTKDIFIFEKAEVKINTRFHEPSTVTITKYGQSETLDFNYKSIGYNFETDHFSQLLREGKKESPIMTYDFSKELMKLLDEVRAKIGLEY